MIQEIRIETVEDLMPLLSEQEYRPEIGRNRSGYLYRGMPDSAYTMETSLLQGQAENAGTGDPEQFCKIRGARGSDGDPERMEPDDYRAAQWPADAVAGLEPQRAGGTAFCHDRGKSGGDGGP